MSNPPSTNQRSTHPAVGRHRRNFFHRRPPLNATFPNPTSSSPPRPQIKSITDVRDWLHSQGFSQYADTFTTNEIDASVLKTLTSEELRDDLSVTNLRHRRQLLDAIAKLAAEDTCSTKKKDPLPEHGRILDHLSNVRTYHSWIRLGIQFLGFSIVTLRLAPDFRTTAGISAAAFYFAIVGVIALLYGIYRYRQVIQMIERSSTTSPKYKPDRAGVVTMLVLVLIASVLALTIITVRL